jgi:predicted MFS family arabinose efflux permease
LVPFAKARNHLDEGQLGLLLLCLGVGSLLSMPLAGALAARYGCRRVIVIATGLLCLAPYPARTGFVRVWGRGGRGRLRA